MKTLKFDPLGARRLAAEADINAHFNAVAVGRAHTDAAHRRKREEALRIAAGEIPREISFAAEAERAGKSVADFAALILSKPDDLAAREDERRRLVEAVRQAPTAAAIAALLAGAAIETRQG